MYILNKYIKTRNIILDYDTLCKKLVSKEEDYLDLQEDIIEHIMDGVNKIKTLTPFLFKPELIPVLIRTHFKDLYSFFNINKTHSSRLKTDNPFRGVRWDTHLRKWYVRIRNSRIGLYDNAVIAAIERDKYIVGKNIKDIRLNFPELFKKSETIEKKNKSKPKKHLPNYIGVTADAKGHYGANIYDGKGLEVKIGSFESIDEAAKAHDIIAYKAGHTTLNFPIENYKKIEKRFLGIYPKNNRWYVRVFYKGKTINVDSTYCPIRAAKIYDIAVFSIKGKVSPEKKNFPWIKYPNYRVRKS